MNETYIENTDAFCAKYELFRMECNVRRMKFMIDNGYFVSVYSDEEWKKFKKLIWGKDIE